MAIEDALPMKGSQLLTGLKHEKLDNFQEPSYLWVVVVGD